MNLDLRKLFKERPDDVMATPLKRTVFWALQSMFCNLKWSDRRMVWPEDFLENYRDFEGNKIDPNEQMVIYTTNSLSLSFSICNVLMFCI